MPDHRTGETPSPRPRFPRWALISFLAATLLLGLLGGLYAVSLIPRGSPPQVERATVLLPGKELYAFSLLDQDGQEFGLEQLAGKWSILFFGFTHCPDVCPTTLHSLSNFSDTIAETEYSQDTQVIFVTVDPARDTPEQLQRYVPFFNPDFIGLTGNADTIAEFTRNLGIVYVHGSPDENGSYSVDHSAAILLIGPSAEMNAIFSPPHDIATITRDYVAIRESF